tara:strand:- start:534 stop:1124 length:591 start_codon:yes stop_codon:yes gene_type:complete
MSNIGFVIGNGSSRRNFDLRRLSHAGNTYGTNAIHREFFPNNLVCISRKHLVDALSWKLHERLYVYSTPVLVQVVKDPKIELVPDIPFTASHQNEMLDNWTSGSYALLLAALSHDIVVCIGTDYSGDSIYKDTDNYWQIVRTDFSAHVQQTQKIIEYYTDTQFIFIQDNKSVANVFERLTNVSYDTYDNMVSLLLT